MAHIFGEFTTTLASGVSSGATSLSVASSTGLPTLASGDTTVVRLDDGNAGAENVIVTAISGTTLTCAATAGAHSSGVSVKGGMLTITSLTQIKKDALALGPEVAVTSAVTATLNRMHRCAPTAADMTLTIPDGTAEGDMIAIRIAQAATKLVTLSNANLIDGSATRIMWKGESAYLRWDSANSTWTKVAGKTIPMAAAMSIGSGTPAVANNTSVQVVLNTADHDPSGMMTNTTTGTITVKRPGLYACEGLVALSSVSAAVTRLIAWLTKNGSGTASVTQDGATGANGSNASTPVSRRLVLAAGDAITMTGYQISGASQTYSNGTAGGPCHLSVTEVPSW